MSERPIGRPARPLLLRRLNARTVLDTIREQAPVSRAEIARLAGLSKPTVSLALRALEEAGLVREAPRRRPQRPDVRSDLLRG